MNPTKKPLCPLNRFKPCRPKRCMLWDDEMGTCSLTLTAQSQAIYSALADMEFERAGRFYPTDSTERITYIDDTDPDTDDDLDPDDPTYDLHYFLKHGRLPYHPSNPAPMEEED